jgi:hypothetical protein
MLSEVARIRETIAASYMAAQWGLTGLAYGTPRHRFISARMERIEAGRQALQTLVGDKALVLVAETLANLPEQPTRYHIQNVLRHELGNTEDTAHLLDYLLDAWETLDLLIQKCGKEDAYKIITASSSFISAKEEGPHE